MDERLRQLIAQGEGLNLEFKRCGALPGKDVFETVCSFANRQGGHILLGVADDGSIEGISKNAKLDVERNIVNVISDPNQFNVSPSLEFEHADIDGKHVLDVWVPMGPSVYRYKGVVYDRMADVDVKVRSDDQISALYLRKQNTYTEQRVYPHVGKEDLRMDMLPRVREMIRANRDDHPWLALPDDGLLKAARLYAKDQQSGEWGFNLAAIMLLGKDETILDACPVYRTDAILRRVNTDRYDDRLTVTTNLIDAYGLLSEFCRKWLPDSFALDGDRRVSARDVIVRELVVNTLIHREYISPFIAQLTIDSDGIRTRNASRCLFAGKVSLDNLTPTPKNPAIANFFTQIGLAEELGSGVRNLYKYSQLYSGTAPDLSDGDFFEASVRVPDVGVNAKSAGEGDATSMADAVERAALELLAVNDAVSARSVAERLDANQRTVRRHLAALVGKGVLTTEKGGRSTVYRAKR